MRRLKLPKIFILTAQSGCGKTTIRKELKRRLPNLFYSVSATTRPKRKNERNRYDYIFLGVDEFLRRKSKNFFLETVKRYGNYYGTPKEPLLAALRKGRNCLMDLEPVGARKIKRLFPKQAVVIFLKSPSQRELASRLSRRPMSERAKRMAEDKRLFSSFAYDYSVLNKELKKAVNEIVGIIKEEIKAH